MYRLVYITTSGKEEAENIGKTLIKEKLIACANIFPIRSIYLWKEELQREEEVAMFIKTKAKLVDEVIKRIKELHSYEVPCIVSLTIEKGYIEFLKWIDKSTK